MASSEIDLLLSYLNRMAGWPILVIGDVILDEYLLGRAERLSREAPIPVLEFTGRDLIPGGAANPAVNIAKLGSYPTQIGVIGSDESGLQLRQTLSDHGIDP